MKRHKNVDGQSTAGANKAKVEVMLGKYVTQ